MTADALLIWSVAFLSTLGIVLRPFRCPEAIWAVLGAGFLVASGMIPVATALAAVAKGNDVYLFLAGMMALSEVARREGVFDWLAGHAVAAARGSTTRLFWLVYGAGVVVTAILSNDATAVVLTPAVFAAATKARVDPLPHLFACAFVANAASFLLPISNPANLVVFDGHVPALAAWLARFLLPSICAVVATVLSLRWAERARLGGQITTPEEPPSLAAGGKIALAAIALTAVVLVIVSARGMALGLPTALLGLAATTLILVVARQSPLPLLKEIPWSVLPLVAGLFVLVEALASTGLIGELAGILRRAAAMSVPRAAFGGGIVVALASNAINNLPTGLIASSALANTALPAKIVDCVLVGVDLGPNLAITGSLATILWLITIRREGQDVSFRRFFEVGLVAMPPALALALVARLMTG